MAAHASNLPILIVGAGISGLSLAQYLRKVGIPFRIFDRDTSIVSRSGGWGLTFHWGLPALKELLPDELYDRLGECNVNPTAQDAGKYRFLDLKTGESLHAATFPTTGRLRVLRSKLRTLLATGVDIEVSYRDEMNQLDIYAVFRPVFPESRRTVSLKKASKLPANQIRTT